MRTGGEESVVIEDLLKGKFELKTLWRRKSEPCGHLGGKGHSRQRQLQVYSPGLSRKSQARHNVSWLKERESYRKLGQREKESDHFVPRK